MAPEAIVQLVDGGEEEEAQRKVVVVQQHLDDNIMSTILSKLPSEPAHSFAVVSKSSGALLRQPAFLQNHLSSRRSLVQLLKDDELPAMVAIQPKDHQQPGGYVPDDLAALLPAQHRLGAGVEQAPVEAAVDHVVVD